MECPHRERQALRLLQLQMREVIDAVREKREDQAGDEPGGVRSGQRAYEQRGARARHDEPGQEHDVVDQHGSDAEPSQRRREHRRDEQRLRIGERAAFGVEDVGIEEMRRRARQLMRDPRQRPCVQQRIAVVVDAVAEMEDLRIGHHGGQRREDDEHRREKFHDWRMSTSSVSAASSFSAA